MPRGKKRRDVSLITNRLSLPDRLPDLDDITRLPSLFSAIRSPLTEVEDRRLFTPDPIQDVAPSSFRNTVASIGPARPARTGQVTSRHLANNLMSPKPIEAFKRPEFTPVCVRRKQRREVLLALGRGGGGKRRPRRNSTSDIRC